MRHGFKTKILSNRDENCSDNFFSFKKTIAVIKKLNLIGKLFLNYKSQS